MSFLRCRSLKREEELDRSRLWEVEVDWRWGGRQEGKSRGSKGTEKAGEGEKERKRERGPDERASVSIIPCQAETEAPEGISRKRKYREERAYLRGHH